MISTKWSYPKCEVKVWVQLLLHQPTTALIEIGKRSTMNASDRITSEESTTKFLYNKPAQITAYMIDEYSWRHCRNHSTDEVKVKSLVKPSKREYRTGVRIRTLYIRYRLPWGWRKFRKTGWAVIEPLIAWDKAMEAVNQPRPPQPLVAWWPYQRYALRDCQPLTLPPSYKAPFL